MQTVSKRLDTGQRLVILLDGLDEAFGSQGLYSDISLNDQVLPSRLPAGIFIVVTSRDDRHLSALADQLPHFDFLSGNLD